MMPSDLYSGMWAHGMPSGAQAPGSMPRMPHQIQLQQQAPLPALAPMNIQMGGGGGGGGIGDAVTGGMDAYNKQKLMGMLEDRMGPQEAQQPINPAQNFGPRTGDYAGPIGETMPPGASLPVTGQGGNPMGMGGPMDLAQGGAPASMGAEAAATGTAGMAPGAGAFLGPGMDMMMGNEEEAVGGGVGAGAGLAVGAGLAPFTGGMSMMFAPMLGQMLGRGMASQ